MNFGEGNDSNITCSFCGKREGQVRKLIAGHNVYICDECIELCNEMLTEDLKETNAAVVSVNELPKPKEIKNILDEYVIGQEEAKADTIFKKVLPEDLMKFGLIPEFAGRLPVVVTLDSLDKDALIKILQEPKNALIKQYQHFLAMDNVELEFEDGALVAIAEEALKRNAGARGLRSIIEEVMRNVMYEVPSRIDVVKCVVTEAAIREHMEPKMVVAS